MRPPQRIHAIASEQHGYVAAWQLQRAGLSASQIETARSNGTLTTTRRGIYRTAGTPNTWKSQLMEIILCAGPGSAASHRAAAVLHGLLWLDEMVEICTPRKRRLHDVGDEAVVHRSIVLPRSDLTKVDAIPCVTVERTLVDLGAVVSRHKVAYALDAAIRMELTDLALVKYVHARRRGRGRRGAGVLAEVLEQHERSGVTESPYERDLVIAIMEAGLPLPRLQYEVTDHRGVAARADLAWPKERLIVEVDGHGFHSDRSQRAHDAERQNRLVALGWTVLRFTTDQIFDNVGLVVSQIGRFLRSWVA